MNFKEIHRGLIVSALLADDNVLFNERFVIDEPGDIDNCIGISANVEYYKKFLAWLTSDDNSVKGAFTAMSEKAQKYAMEYKGRNVAYGPRIMFQIDKVISELRDFPDTRRAVITILEKEDHLINDHVKHDDGMIVEFPCTIAYTFHISDNKLCASTIMRSNNIVSVVGLDVFLATSLQRMIAVALNLECGEYSHFMINAHIIEAELERASSYVGK